jgi:hypothetical protein
MLNIHGDILDLLNESEYYLFSILLNYGTKSCPDNSVLLHRTGWGLNKLQTAKKSLISKGLLKVEARFNPTKGAKGRESNAYVITTDLASKYNDKLIRNKLVNNKVVKNKLVDNKLVDNRVYKELLKPLIIETKVIIEKKEENEKPSLLISDFEKLKAENEALQLKLQTELKKEKEKSSAKKESSVLPKNGITQIDEGLTYPKNFTEELKQAFKDFIQMRKDIRKPFKLLKSKQTKLDSLGKDIANFGEENVLGAILRSTENEYQGIFVKDFADKHKKSNNGKQTNNNKQPIDDGLSYAERAMRERFGSDLLTDQYQNGSSDDNYQGVEQEF